VARKVKNARFYKFDINGNLFGSIKYDLTPAELSVWYRLMAIAKISSEEGTILKTEWNMESLIAILNIQQYGGVELLNNTIAKLVARDTIKILSDGSYLIPKWHEYQDTPVWVEQQRENLLKAVAKAKKRAADAESDMRLQPSEELIEVANKIDGAVEKLTNGGDDNE
jgi:hypothetical protein